MRANVKDPVAIELVLLPVLQPVQKAVAVGCLEGDPGARVRVSGTPACGQIDVAVVASQRYKGIQAVVEAVDGGQIHRGVAFAQVEGNHSVDTGAIRSEKPTYTTKSPLQ